MTYSVTTAQITIIVVLTIWELVWKSVALWKAAHRDQRGWFAALLVLNTAGILPILYILTTEQRKDGAGATQAATQKSGAQSDE